MARETGPLLRLSRLGRCAAGCAATAVAVACVSRGGEPPATAPMSTLAIETASVAEAAEPPATAAIDAQGGPSARVSWRFHAGAPVAGAPAVAADGTVYVGTTEGYVHCLGADGSFRWSYTVAGGVVGSPVIDPRGRILVGTLTGRVYALRPSGRASWVYRSHTPIVTDVVVDRRGAVYFGARDQHVHAVSPSGGGRWRSPAYNAITAGPVLSRSGEVVIATRTPKLVFMRGVLERQSHRFARPIDSTPVVDSDGTVYVLSGEELVALRAGERRWVVHGVGHAPGVFEGGLVVAGADGSLRWIGRDGSARARIELGGVAHAAPAASMSGRAFVPMADGSLVDAETSGEARTLALGRAPAATPVIDEERGRLVVSTGEGIVASVVIEPGAAHGR